MSPLSCCTEMEPMAELTLDGLELACIEDVHARFEQALSLPDCYGRNLDALFDCLTDLPEAVTVRLLHREALEERLGRRGRALVRLLRRAAAENARLTLLEE